MDVENDDTSTTTDDSPLSLGEAVKLFSAPEPEAGSDEEQPADDEGQREEEPETDELTEEEGDEEEGEVDEEEQVDPEDAGEEEEEQDSEQGRFVGYDARVKLADGSFATVAELVESGLRRDDYTRKTQETSAEKQATLKERETLTQLRQANEEVRDYTIAVLEQFMPQKPDESLFDIDVMEYMKRDRDYRQRMEQLDYLKQQRAWDQQEAAKLRAEESRELSNAEWQKLLAHPEMAELKDETKGKALLSGIMAYGKSHGYSEQDLRGALAFDHRQAIILRKAMAYDALQETKKTVIPKKTEGRPPIQKSGKRLNATNIAHREAKVAMNRLSQTGSIKDGVKALLAMEKTKG
jgi:hypothetical protein